MSNTNANDQEKSVCISIFIKKHKIGLVNLTNKSKF